VIPAFLKVVVSSVFIFNYGRALANSKFKNQLNYNQALPMKGRRISLGN